MSTARCALVVVAAALAAGAGLSGGAASAAPVGSASPPHTLAHNARLYTPPPDKGARRQMTDLIKDHDFADAALIETMISTPQAVWFTGGTPAEVQIAVHSTVTRAAATGTVPVLVAYDVPFRDCAQYSAGGAADTAAYDAWIDAFAAGLGDHNVAVLLEPDSLGVIPYNTDINGNHEWCQPDLTGTGLTPQQANQARYDQLNHAVDALEAHPNVSVYLDGTHSAWLGVGDIADRLVRAGVQRSQGFFLNVSNYQFAPNSVQYGTWISDCITYATAVHSGDFAGCPNQYWNGGPDGTAIAQLLGAWTGVALRPYGVWSDSAGVADLNTSGINARFAGMLGNTAPTTRFVVDTSRNGQGPNDMSAYAAAPYNQPSQVVSALQGGNWCNPPGAGLGLRPTTDTGTPLLDAYLWVKIPGESDGSCDIAGGARAWDYAAYNPWGLTGDAQRHFDPLWGMVDPAAGEWFPQQALQLAQNASPPLR
jgi:endoglucanase